MFSFSFAVRLVSSNGQCDACYPLQIQPSQTMGLEQLLWWGGYVWEETCLGKGPGVGCQRDPDSNWPFHSLALDLGASECMELQRLTYMLGIMALALKSGCEVESVHE